MDNAENELNESFTQLIREQENDLGIVNYGSVADDGEDDDINTNGAGMLSGKFEHPSKQAGLGKSVSLEHIPMETFNQTFSPSHESTSLMRQRVKSVKETSRDMKQILEEMPSRTIGRRHGAKLSVGYSTMSRYGTMYRHNRLASVQQDEIDTNELYDEMSADGDIGSDELRDLPVSMTLKKKVRSKAKRNEEEMQSKSIGCFSLWKFKMTIKWRHAKDDLQKFIASGKLWNYHLKNIEGDFGTGVLSYFTFLRAIFLLSLPSFFLGFLFISIPQLFDRPDKPECVFTAEGLLTGANCLTNTIMYQGYYTNTTINAIGNAFYNMPLAYLLATFGYFVLCLIWLVRTTGILFRENYIDTKEDSSNYISKVFCSWDFGTISQSAAQIRHKTITTELKEILAEQRRGDEHRTACEKFEVVILRIVSWSFYLALVGGAIALIYFLNKIFICEIKDRTQNNPIFQDLALPLIVSAINLILPYIIDWITHLEKYKYPRHQLYISVLRNFIFKMSILAVICAFWTSNDVQRCSSTGNETSVCWETQLGQEIYRLIIVDFIFCLLFSTLCAEFLRNIIAKCTGNKGPEFAISNNVMDLIYGQTLCWIGVYFSPLLAFINMIKYFLLFYVKKLSVMNNCRPATERWRATQSRTLFNTVQLVSFILSTAFLIYVIFNKAPSESCGPFRGQDRAYDVIVKLLDDLSSTTSGQWLATVLRILTSVWVLDAIVIGILVLVIFARSKTHGLQYLASTLEEQIAIEGKDKALLLKWLQTISARKDSEALNNNHSNDASGPSGIKKQAGNVLFTNGTYVDDDLDIIEGDDE